MRAATVDESALRGLILIAVPILTKMHSLDSFVDDFAVAFKTADARYPRAFNVRTKEGFQPGIGPHNEADTIKLVMSELMGMNPTRYAERFATGVPYPENRRRKCDLCLGVVPDWDWAIEVKMIRFLGDNGKLNDNMLMHVLSPYPEHRSALTDCDKLMNSKLGTRKAIVIYGYDHDQWPLKPAIDAFEVLANSRVRLGHRKTATFNDLVHPIHQRGRVFGWELSD